MKGKTIWIVVGIIVVVLIGFFIWRSKKQRDLALQAQLQQQQNQALYGPGSQTGQNQAGLSGTIDSVGGVIDSLAGLFGSFGGGGGGSSSGGVDQATINAIANDCELLYNTPLEVQACVAAKLNSLT